MDEGVTQGPLIDQAAVNKIEEHIANAMAKGGKLAAGGKRHVLGQTFFEPTIILDATHDMLVVREKPSVPSRRCSVFARTKKSSAWPTTPSSGW
jgi:succinate-semialdehyde dehydrogenase/glutarate-semialdehyde dehydrogenase